MSEDLEQKTPKKSKPSFAYAIVSIAMILFVIGLFSCGVVLVQQQLNQLKESVAIDINLKQDVTDSQKTNLEHYLKKQKSISKFSFKSKEQAAAEFEKELGQNFREILGENPLYDAYIIHLTADYSNSKFIADIKSAFLSQEGVQEVEYSTDAIKTTSATLKPITIGVSILSLIMLIVAFLIIDNTIRLSMYSQRFTIRSMQLIGADEWFIRKPYIKKSIISGLISALIAILFLSGLIYFAVYKFSLFFSSNEWIIFLCIALGLIIFGIFISMISTYFAVNKYLKIKLDELY